MDNYATHKTPEVRDWLSGRPRFHVHFTPTSGSWLNLVEVWFGIIDRQAIRRGVFTSVTDLNAKIRQFITGWNGRAHPFVWTKTATRPRKSQPKANFRNATLEVDHSPVGHKAGSLASDFEPNLGPGRWALSWHHFDVRFRELDEGSVLFLLAPVALTLKLSLGGDYYRSTGHGESQNDCRNDQPQENLDDALANIGQCCAQAVGGIF